MEKQASWVTALGWVQTSSPFPGQAGVCPDSPAESLLVGRLDGSLCWLQVSLQDLHTDSTELTLCHRKEGETCQTGSVRTLLYAPRTGTQPTYLSLRK